MDHDDCIDDELIVHRMSFKKSKMAEVWDFVKSCDDIHFHYIGYDEASDSNSYHVTTDKATLIVFKMSVKNG